jgi:hypothetical protein
MKITFKTLHGYSLLRTVEEYTIENLGHFGMSEESTIDFKERVKDLYCQS